jgi:5S rRNA maturation endonuclease (ribonuclease M5)
VNADGAFGFDDEEPPPSGPPPVEPRIDARELFAIVRERAQLDAAVIRRGVQLTRAGRELVGLCPFHDDKAPSFRVNQSENVWNCKPCAALGNTKPGDGDAIGFVAKLDRISPIEAAKRLAAEQGIPLTAAPPRDPGQMQVVARYPYADVAGVLLATKERLEHVPRNGSDKGMRWRSPDGTARRPEPWTPILYRLPEVVTAITDRATVVVVEGEKCVDALTKLGIVATCNEDGAGRWTSEHTEHLRGARVVVLPDNDAAGTKHAKEVETSLLGVAAAVSSVVLPNLQSKGDVFDWLAAGGSRDVLADLLEDAVAAGFIANAKRDIQAQTGPTKRWKRLINKNAADLAKRPRAAVDWLVQGLLTRNSVGIIGAESKGAKTWVGAEIMIGVATGTPIFGVFEVPRRGWSLALFIEDGENNLHSRLSSLVQGRRMKPEDALSRIVYESRMSIDLMSDDDLAGIIASARAMPEMPTIIYIDPFRDAHTGKENDSDDMSKVMHRLRMLRNITGATIIVPHHMGRPSKDRAGQRLAHRLRGSTAIHGAVDCGIYMELKDSTRSKTNATWSNLVDVELRDGAGAGMFGLQLDVQIERGAAATAGWAHYEDPRAMGAGEDDTSTAAKVLRALEANGGPMSTEEVAAAAGVARKTAGTHLLAAEAKNAVVRRGQGKNTRWMTNQKEDRDDD